MPSNMALVGLVTGALPTLLEASRPLRAKLVPGLLLLTLVAVMDWRDNQTLSYLAAALATHYVLDLDIGHPQLRGIPNSLFLHGMGWVEAAVLRCCSSCCHRWVGGTWRHPPQAPAGRRSGGAGRTLDESGATTHQRFQSFKYAYDHSKNKIHIQLLMKKSSIFSGDIVFDIRNFYSTIISRLSELLNFLNSAEVQYDKVSAVVMISLPKC